MSVDSKKPLFVQEAYSFVFDTAMAILSAVSGRDDEVVSKPIATMMLGLINDWERGLLESPIGVQAAYDFSVVYRALLDEEGMEVIDGKLVAKE